MEPVLPSSHVIILEAIEQVGSSADASRLAPEVITRTTLELLLGQLPLPHLIACTQDLLDSAARIRPSQGKLLPFDALEALLELAFHLQDWQELQEDDDERDEATVFSDNAIDPDCVLVRDPATSPELQELGILECLQRYPTKGLDRRWSPEEAIAFLLTKAHWLDAANETCTTIPDSDCDGVPAKAVVLTVPSGPGAMQVQLVDVRIPLDE